MGNVENAHNLEIKIDATRPKATIDQAAGQLDPANASPINFTVVFSEPVDGFTKDDVTLGGTAPGKLSAVVSGSGTTYHVAVSGMTGSGTVIASLAAGIASDAAGNSNEKSTGTDNSVRYNAPPAIGGVVVLAEKGLMTWNAQNSDGVAIASLTVDGKIVSQVNGPYAAASGVNFSGVFGTLSAGNHNYAVTATDKAGNSSQYTGTFNVAANPGPAVGGAVVLAEKGLMTWNAQDSDGVASASLMVDGKIVSQVNGPYAAASGVNFSGVFGTLSAGNHNYAVTATDKAGNSSQYTGTFNVAANPGPAVGGAVVLAEKGLMTWNAQDSDGVASASLMVDGKIVSQVNGPYAAASGVNFSGVFGTLSAGNHNYAVTATDKAGNSSTSVGTFNVAAAPKSAVGAKSLATSVVWGALASRPSTSAKVDWLYDDM